jgi:hypothetical protein
LVGRILGPVLGPRGQNANSSSTKLWR